MKKDVPTNSTRLCRSICLTLVLLLSGCGGNDDALTSLANPELKEQAYKCGSNANPAPGYAIACANIQRECERRSAQLGYKLC